MPMPLRTRAMKLTAWIQWVIRTTRECLAAGRTSEFCTATLRKDAVWAMALRDPPLRGVDRQIVDTGVALAHQAGFRELPKLHAMGAEPLSGIIMPLVFEEHGHAILAKAPQGLFEPIAQLFRPLAVQKGLDLRATL